MMRAAHTRNTNSESITTSTLTMKKNTLLVLIMFFAVCSIIAQPANDNCANAQSLGSLPTPGACIAGVQNGAPTTVAGTVTGATPGSPYVYQTGCSGAATSTATFANDVWYSFTATGTTVNINITGSIVNPNIAFYQGTCGNLGGRGCAIGNAGGTGSLTVPVIQVGQVYYIQISGNSSGAGGNFNLSVDNDIDCNNCLTGATLTASPLPVNGAYQPGQVVTFCYKITGYTHQNTNWLHGVQVSFGNGWSGISATTPAASCGGSGVWGYYPGGTTSSWTGIAWPAGFYFDYSPTDGNPGNNLGDNCAANGANLWTFCFNLTVKPGCSPGSNLSVTVNTSGDGESGSWSSAGCSGDNPSILNAVGACCAPTMAATPSCSVGATGTATATPVGGGGPFTYSWAPGGQTTQTATSLSAGTYTVTVTNATNCAATATVTVPSTAQPTVTVNNQTVCNGTSATLTATPSGGAGTYLWNTGATTSTLTATPGTTTTYTVTYTLNGCPSNPASGTITVNPVPTVTVPANISQCAGTTIAASSFTSAPAGATYAWTNSNPSIGLAASGAGNVPSFTATNATAAPITGTITVTPTLAGCTGAPVTYTITVNPVPTATFAQSANQCLAGNSFNFTNTGSSGAGYTYSWNFGGGGASPATSTNNSVAGVTYTTPGTYVITHIITAPGGCTATITSNITIYPAPTAITSSTGPATCGSSNGSITISGSTGGTSPYTYSVDGGAFSGTLSYTGQTAGSHTIVVKDANGCTFTTTVNVPTSSGPTALGVTTVNSTCGGSNGIINIGGTTGGTGPFTYSVNGSGFTATTSYTGLAAGTYPVVVKDASGCTYNTTATVSNTPGPTALATSTANSSCGASNGSVTLGAATGGTSPYTYSLNGSAFTATTNYTGLAAGTYTVVVHDANNCALTVNPIVGNNAGPTAIVITPGNSTCGNSNGTLNLGGVTGGTGPYTYSVAGSAFTATVAYTGFAAGTYTVIVKDANGCTYTTSGTVANTPGPTTIAVTTGNSSCGASNGTITLGAVTGGVAPYTYSVNASAFSGTVGYTGFAAGSYTVIVKDANGCTFTTTANVNNATGPTALAVTSTAANCGASNGTVTIGAVTGGTGPYLFSYNGGAYSATTNYTTQPAGTYNVSVKDANGCTFTTTIVITNTPGPTALATTPTSSTCGAANGAIAIGAVTGGTAAYTYSINASAYTGSTNYTGLAAGTYTVTVKDVNGCTFTVNPIITNIPGPTAQAFTTVNSTCGLSNGSITVGATTGGTSPYTYSFNGGAFGGTVNFTALAAATYTLTVKDANGCTFTVNPIVSNTPGPTAQATTSVNATCGNTNGAVNIGATTGGTPAYTYSFDGGGFTATTSYTGLAAGTHTVTVKDANGCTFTVNPAVGNTPGPTAIIRTITNSTCGAANGAVTLGAVTGGTGPYTYSFNGSPFTATTSYTGLIANTYPVIVQDANGCQFTTSAVVTDISGLTASITAQTNVSCNGGNNGSVTVTASGSVAPYSYSLNGGLFGGTNTFTGLTVGSYTVTAKDANGCTLGVPVNITQPPVLTGVIATQTNVSCFGGNTGAVTITAGGGTSPYTYSINGGAFGASSNFTGLNAGSHPVVVKDANGCTVNVPVNITQPTALTLSTSSVNAICTAANGSATVVASGATPAYSYLWSPGSQTTATANNITAGNYSVLVTDFNGCTQTANVSVGSNPGGVATISSSNNVTCTGAANGNATVSMSAASTPPYIYSWSPSGQSTVTATNLPPGTHTVTVTDGNGCVASTSVIITEPTVITNSFTNTNVSCFGGNNGSSTINPSGGTPPYTYMWSVGQTTQTAGGLTAGTYTVTITDANGCTKTATTAITQPTGMALTETHVDANCNLSNGSATVNVTGGVGPYAYSWSTLPPQNVATATALSANTYVATVTDANGCSQNISVTVNNLAGPVASVFSQTNVSCNGQSDGNITVTVTGGTTPFTYAWSPSGGSLPTATNLAAGTYTLNATDAHGCTASTSATITEPNVLVTTYTSIDPRCNGDINGSITSTTIGGTAPYSYLWSPGAVTTSNLTGVGAGSYLLQVTDAHHCVTTTNVTLNNPPALTATNTTNNVSCSGMCNGSATMSVSSGTGPIMYLWSDMNAQTTPTATALCAGTYTVNATDANGCTVSSIATITSPSSLAVNVISHTNVTCYGACNGTAAAMVTGGTAPFNYLWSPTGTAGSNVNNLCANTYTVAVTDGNGCTATNTVLITQPNQLIASISNTNVTCYGACDAQATAVYTGGTGPYTFVWTPALQTTPTVTSICAGILNLTVTDSLQCTASSSVVVTEPTILTVSTTTTNSNCGVADGSACASITGGSPPFIYSWNDPATQATSCANGLNAGVYTISVTDNHNCSVTNVANVNDNGAPVVTIPSSTNVTCFGAANGSAQGNITGGIVPYITTWTPGGQTNAFANNLSGGIYSLLVTDSVGCTGSASVTILEPSQLVSAIITTVNTSCNLACDGSLTVQAGGGTSPYTYLWNDVNTQTTSTATGLCAQNYSVTVTDLNGCTSTSTAPVSQPTPIVISLASSTNVSCNGGNDGALTISVAGGTPGYTYAWSPSVGSSASVTNLPAGTYQVTVTDLRGCAQTMSFTITEPSPLVLTPNSNFSTCGNSNGSAGVSVIGGISPYSYLWSPGSSATAIITNVPAGTYNVVVTDAHGCNATASSVVSDSAGPVITTPIAFTPPSCYELSNGTATVVATGGQPLYSYTWNTTPVQTSQTASALSAGVYQVTVKDQNNCIVQGTVTITQPSPLQVITSPTDSICIGQATQIYAAGSGGTSPYSYTWNPNSLGATGGPFVVSPVTTTTYTVSAVDAHNCVSNYYTTEVFVFQQLAVTATDVTVCSGVPVVISATASNGNGGPYTYSWSNGPVTSSQTVTPTGASSIDYTVTVNDNNCSIAVQDVATVTINPLPVSFMSVVDTAGCEDFQTTFTANSNIGTSYSWNFGDGATSVAGGTIVHTYLTPGTYDVTLTTTTLDGCVSSITTDNFIDVYPSPIAGFTASPNPTTTTSPFVTFTDQSIGSNQWNWDFIYSPPITGIFTDTLQNPSFSYPDSGIYVVQQTVTNNFGCTDVAYHNVEVVPEYVLFAPNAFTPLNHDGNNDIFMPKGVGIDPEHFEMSIYDRWGNQIFKTTDINKGWDGRANGGSNIAQIDVYVWKIKTKDYRGQNHSYVGHVTIVK